MAAVAEQEGRAISERTKAALATAKARGFKLGWFRAERVSERSQTTTKFVHARSDLFDKRRGLMEAWAELAMRTDFGKNVVTLAGA